MIGQHLVPKQGRDFPLYTYLDSVALLPFDNLFQFGAYNHEKCLEFRQFLKPYVEEDDPHAMYMYAKTFDLFPFGLGDSNSAEIALQYYEKAALLNHASAEFDLFGVYAYSFMNQPVDKEKAIKYLRAAIFHGDEETKLNGYRFLIAALAEKNITKDSTVYYLEKILSLDARNTYALDYLGSIYAEKNDYPKAAAYYLRSDNENSQLTAAQWMIEGEVLEQDIEGGLEIIYRMYDKISIMEGYMGSMDPVFLLCQFYKCKKIINKEQLRGIDLGAADCCFD